MKARIEEFNALAGYEYIHSMTSRDLTENVEQLQIYSSLELIRDKAVAVLVHIGKHAGSLRLHGDGGSFYNVAAQATTLGKRFASAADEMLRAVDRIEELLTCHGCAYHMGARFSSVCKTGVICRGE